MLKNVALYVALGIAVTAMLIAGLISLFTLLFGLYGFWLGTVVAVLMAPLFQRISAFVCLTIYSKTYAGVRGYRAEPTFR
jgi:hypothetical protein